MNADKLGEMKTLWLGLSLYYRQQLSPEQVRMYAEDLEDLELADVARAIRALRIDPARKFLPMPSEVREKILGDTNQDAQDAASRIVEAMAKFGWTNGEKARTHIGELGWLVVQREGGWQTLCERTNNDDLPTLKAQWRELAKALRSRAQRGALGTPPGILPDNAPPSAVTFDSAGRLSIGVTGK